MHLRSRHATQWSLVFILGAAAPVQAQTVWAGFTVCECSPHDVPRELMAFKVPITGAEATPDVNFVQPDGMTVGSGTRVGFSWVVTGGTFTLTEEEDDRIFAMVTAPGMMLLDWGERGSPNAGTMVEPQLPGALVGHLSAVLEEGPMHPRITWSPIRESSPEMGDGACPANIPLIPEMFIGYNIYRLSRIAHPSPTLRDFVTDGEVQHADVTLLDFSIPDVDGMGGSDLDPTDSLFLRNPDGLRDTGDEVLVFEDTTTTDMRNWWYRVQPVALGDQAYYDTGLSARAVPADRLDLDGDGVPESVDIGRDGHVEFIDPSGRGLGLTTGSEILSSPLPAGWRPIPGLVACGAGQAAVEASCDDGIDDDGDGLTDCSDPDCEEEPECSDLDIIIVVGDDGGRSVVGWDETNGTGPFELLLGDLDDLLLNASHEYSASACGIVGTSTVAPESSGNVFYLLSHQGSGDTGTDSSGNPRPPSSTSCR
ncbi:MAG: hypothetical protein AAF533_08555 [Acidobacteriota bacterium]